MNTTSHPVAPEEIMALLDGELSAAEAQAVSAHLATCAECAGIAEQFQSTSQWLARWEVDPVPARIESAVKKPPVVKPGRRFSSRWSWQAWTAGGGLLAAASLALPLVVTNLNHKAMYSKARLESSQSLETPREGKAAGFSGDGELRQSAAPLPSMAAPPPPPPPLETAVSKTPSKLKAAEIGGATTPMIAHTVSMVVVVKDLAASRAALDSILLRHHGYSAQLNVTTPENGARGFNASLRIPAQELAAALAEFKGLGRVENEIQNGEEVTQQHADLLARLHNARETEERFRAILAQRTGKVSDVLEVEESISRVRGEIEQMEAEQQTLEHRVDFATVDIQLTEQFKASLDAPADSTATRLHNGFVAGYRNAADTVLGIVLFFVEYGPSILIWLVLLGTPAWLVWRHRRRAA